MTGRQLAGVLAAAFAIVLAIIITLLPLDENDPAHPHQAIRKLLEATSTWDTIVIGSSLTQAAFPPVTDPGLLPDRTAVRISRPILTQNELMLIADYALDAKATHIFIEAERLTRTTVSDRGVVRASIDELAKPVRRNLRAILEGEYPRTWTINDESYYLDGQMPSWGLAFNETYVVKPTPLSDPGRWEAFLKDAKENGTSVSLLVYPRSQAASDFLKDADEVDVRKAIIQFAERYGLELFYPAVAWPNELFADRAHLNQFGRDRYLRELAAWLKAKA